jgi:hypothetical protein
MRGKIPKNEENGMSHKRTYRFMAVIAVLAILLASCGGGSSGADKLIGNWEYKEPTSGMSIILTITKDKLSFSVAGLGDEAVDYTYVDEDTLKVKSADGAEEEEVSYTLKGDVLTLDMEGEMVEFTKVK